MEAAYRDIARPTWGRPQGEGHTVTRSSKGYWRTSANRIVHQALTNRHLAVQRLSLPAVLPVIEMAGFGSPFAGGPASEPGIEMAGFARSRRYRPTVSRFTRSSRAMRLRDQPWSARV